MGRGVCGATVLLVTAGVVWGFDAGADARAESGASARDRVVKTVKFTDATGEDPDAPDIGTVTVSNGEAFSPSSTAITFRIGIANRPVLARDVRIAVWIDTDDDPSTGLGEVGALPGADYLATWDPTLGRDASLRRCGRSRCTATSAPSFRFSYSRGATFTMQAADLGGTRRFRFSARAYSGTAVDVAPSAGAAWTYRVLFRRPAAPRGSRTFAVRFTVTRADGSVLTSGRVSCTARVGGKRVAPRSARFVGRRATCVFVLPLSSVGKTIRGTITVVSGGTRVTKSFRRTIR
jgi:hypothetical protein